VLGESYYFFAALQLMQVCILFHLMSVISIKPEIVSFMKFWLFFGKVCTWLKSKIGKS